MIEVAGLTVRFGGVTSLDDMSVTFEAGTCGLIGPNGAGKTTFFNVLSGFVRPVTGTVRAVTNRNSRTTSTRAASARSGGAIGSREATAATVAPRRGGARSRSG